MLTNIAKVQLIALIILLAISSSTSMTMQANDRLKASDIDRLVRRSLDLIEKCSRKPAMVGIAGGPGAGKSTIAQTVADKLLDEHGCPALVVSMDGYHIPQKKLNMLTMAGMIKDENGKTLSYEEAMSRRGATFTFDHEGLIADLRRVRQEERVSFPIYDRCISDPRLHGANLESKHLIVLCEGNYLLALDDDAWSPLGEIWDDRWYVHVDEDVNKTRLIARHMERWNEEKERRFGKGRDGAQKKVEESDWKNALWISKHSQQFAYLIIDNTH